jgi:hypothetical protein
MKKNLITVLTTLLGFSTIAVAQSNPSPSLRPVVGNSNQDAPSCTVQPPTPRPRSETRATALALGGTLASISTIALGYYSVATTDPAAGVDIGGGLMVLTGAASLLVTPSLGHFYAGERFTTGMALRLGGATAAITSLAATRGDCLALCSQTEKTASTRWQVLAATGAATFVAGVVWDIATAHGAARDYNRDHGLVFAPTIVREHGESSTSLALNGTF